MASVRQRTDAMGRPRYLAPRTLQDACIFGTELGDKADDKRGPIEHSHYLRSIKHEKSW